MLNMASPGIRDPKQASNVQELRKDWINAGPWILIGNSILNF